MLSRVVILIVAVAVAFSTIAPKAGHQDEPALSGNSLAVLLLVEATNSPRDICISQRSSRLARGEEKAQQLQSPNPAAQFSLGAPIKVAARIPALVECAHSLQADHVRLQV